METTVGLQIITITIGVMWAIREVFVRNRLQKDIDTLKRQLDESTQRLLRAREAVIQAHKASVYLREFAQAGIEVNETYLEKRAEQAAYAAELRGLAFAIGDQKLLDLVIDAKATKMPEFLATTMESGRFHELHTRITRLLEEVPRINPKP